MFLTLRVLNNNIFFVCFKFTFFFFLGTLGTLKITGYLRGTALSVNQLVHIPGLGDFQLSQIDAPNDPHKFDK